MVDLKINILSGPERIRRRPAVIFGSEDLAGVQNMVQSLLEIWLEEAQLGHSHRITLTAYADGSVGLQDDGRGLWFGQDDAVWQALFCQLHSGRRGEESPKRKLFEDPGPDYLDHDNLAIRSAVCSSEYMDVHASRDGISYKLHFEKGENIGGLSKDLSQKPSGTALRFKPDREVFTETELPKQWIREKARMLAVLVPGITGVFREETADGFAESTWCYPNGIGDFLREMDTQCTATGIYLGSLEGEGQERYNRPRYHAKIQMGLRFSADPGFVRCYHNFRELTCGGRHMDILLKEITRLLQVRICRRITMEEVKNRLQLVVVTASGQTEWENACCMEIKSTVLRDMASDLLRDDFIYYLSKNEKYLEALFYQG